MEIGAYRGNEGVRRLAPAFDLLYDTVKSSDIHVTCFECSDSRDRIGSARRECCFTKQIWVDPHRSRENYPYHTIDAVIRREKLEEVLIQHSHSWVPKQRNNRGLSVSQTTWESDVDSLGMWAGKEWGSSGGGRSRVGGDVDPEKHADLQPIAC